MYMMPLNTWKFPVIKRLLLSDIAVTGIVGEGRCTALNQTKTINMD